MSGRVILVGAGPGDAGLLTVKGQKCISEAEVIVFDRLVSPAILAQVSPSAEMIDVGKAAAHHKVPQEQINQILLDKALEGKYVVRLKGGDPFVFGRGGEELELLCQHGVDFEVVPGVTSAIAAAAYGGIPVTHRDFCSSLHIVTGHARAGKPLTIDFDALVRTGGTLVFLMGVTAMPKIVEGLLAAGMSADMPAAMVEGGTTPAQRRCDATLATLPQKAEAMGIKSPSIIIVGKVCSLAEEFCWFHRQALKGKKILVTRPAERSGTLASKLRANGADVLEYPCIETVPILPCADMEAALQNIEQYQWLCFTSPAGVECMWTCLRGMGLDARALGNVKIAVIGSGTSKALMNYGIAHDLIPEVYDAEHLGADLANVATGKVLVLRAEIGSVMLNEALDAKNIAYDDISVYKTIYENPYSAQLREKLDCGEISYVTFTSASTVKGFVSSVGDDADFSKIVGMCIGVQTAQEAQKYGIAVKIAKKATISALIELISENI